MDKPFDLPAPLQQGDVLLFRIPDGVEFPKTAKSVKIENNKAILAVGEATGHCHFFDTTEWTPDGDKADKDKGGVAVMESDRDIPEFGGKLFFSVKAPMKLYHGKHKSQWAEEQKSGHKDAHQPLEVPAGRYVVRIVKEIDPFTEATRNVAD